MNGKGSRGRPVSVPRDEYERRWAATFGRIEDIGGMATADGQRLPAGTLGYVIHEVGGLAKPDSMPQIASHEPDPSGGKNIVT